jgi:hypothetical protein
MSDLINPGTAPVNPASSSPPVSTINDPFLSSPERIESARAAWVAAGHDVAAFDEALCAAGVKYEPDTRSAEQKAHDAEFWGPDRPDYQPSDYKLTFNQEQLQQSTEVLAEASALAGETLAAMGLPPTVGAGLMEHVADIAGTIGRQSEAAQKTWKLEQKTELRRIAGSDEALAEMIRDAGLVIGLAADGTDRAFFGGEALLKSLGLNSAWAVRTLANYGRQQRLWAKDRPA